MTKATSPLPPAYAPFQTVFERLSDQMRDTILGQLEQLEPLFHIVDEPVSSSRGDIAGLGSITQHGELSNILQSELLLRTEAPLEFLRRIVEAETIYHEKEYQDDGAKRVMRLMISVGPGILGHGRIFSLAALFFFARVANLRQETLHWCYLPNATGPVWSEEISLNTIKRFLKTASFHEMTVDDMDAARKLWSNLYAPTKGAPQPIMLDWVIGAYPQANGISQSSAIVQSKRIFGYRLEPQEEEKPRSAQLFLKRNTKAYRPVHFVFPDDTVCLSVLNRPFAPIKPNNVVAPTSVLETKRMKNWAPHYISAPGSKAKFVKVSGGVLILFHPSKNGFKGQYFLPVGQTSKIAGLRLKEQQLHILLQTVSGPQEQLEYSVVDLSVDGKKPIVRATQTKALPSAQLFRDQSRYALPILAGDIDPSFHATNGKSFSLHFESGQNARFTANLDTSTVIYSNGLHRVVRAEVDGKPILRTLRANNSAVHMYSLDTNLFDETKLYDMLYVSTHGQLAFSMMPNIWILPGQYSLAYKGALRQINPTLQCQFASYEKPLSIRRSTDDIHATIWSDIRYGGDGKIRNVQLRNGRTVSVSKIFNVRQDVGNVVEIIQADGIWIVTANHQGVPETLHHYFGEGRNEKHNNVYNLGELINGSQTILLGDRNHG